MNVIFIIFLCFNLPTAKSNFSFFDLNKCTRRNNRSRKGRIFSYDVNVPLKCRIHFKSIYPQDLPFPIGWCDEPGPNYPREDIKRFLKENQLIFRQKFKEQKHLLEQKEKANFHVSRPLNVVEFDQNQRVSRSVRLSDYLQRLLDSIDTMLVDELGSDPSIEISENKLNGSEVDSFAKNTSKCHKFHSSKDCSGNLSNIHKNTEQINCVNCRVKTLNNNSKNDLKYNSTLHTLLANNKQNIVLSSNNYQKPQPKISLSSRPDNNGMLTDYSNKDHMFNNSAYYHVIESNSEDPLFLQNGVNIQNAADNADNFIVYGQPFRNSNLSKVNNKHKFSNESQMIMPVSDYNEFLITPTDKKSNTFKNSHENLLILKSTPDKSTIINNTVYSLTHKESNNSKFPYTLPNEEFQSPVSISNTFNLSTSDIDHSTNQLEILTEVEDQLLDNSKDHYLGNINNINIYNRTGVENNKSTTRLDTHSNRFIINKHKFFGNMLNNTVNHRDDEDIVHTSGDQFIHNIIPTRETFLIDNEIDSLILNNDFDNEVNENRMNIPKFVIKDLSKTHLIDSEIKMNVYTENITEKIDLSNSTIIPDVISLTNKSENVLARTNINKQYQDNINEIDLQQNETTQHSATIESEFTTNIVGLEPSLEVKDLNTITINQSEYEENEDFTTSSNTVDGLDIITYNKSDGKSEYTRPVCISMPQILSSYFAKNTRNQWKMLINMTPLENYIYLQICKNQYRQQKCGDRCFCRQRYSIMLMPVYEKNSETGCESIYMDRFMFPTHCECMCLPLHSLRDVISQSTSTPVQIITNKPSTGVPQALAKSYSTDATLSTGRPIRKIRINSKKRNM